MIQFFRARLFNVLINVALSDITKCHSKGDATSKRGKNLKNFFLHVSWSKGQAGMNPAIKDRSSVFTWMTDP